MSEENDEIVPYGAYETLIAANIAKTKLDAFGVPCFLTGENFVAQFPLQNELFTGVQLFIFKNDWEQVREILNEGQSL